MVQLLSVRVFLELLEIHLVAVCLLPGRHLLVLLLQLRNVGFEDLGLLSMLLGHVILNEALVLVIVVLLKLCDVVREFSVDFLQLSCLINLGDVVLLVFDHLLAGIQLHLEVLLVAEQSLQLIELFSCLLERATLLAKLPDLRLIFSRRLLQPLLILILNDIVALINQVSQLERPKLIHFD